MSSAPVLPAGGGADSPAPATPRSHRDPDSDRGTDHYGPGAGGKKRKVPAFAQASGPSEVDHSPSSDPTKSNPIQTTFPTNYRLARSDAAKACSFKKALFLRRKAAFITLYLDAQSAMTNGTAKVKPGSNPVPKVPDFEKLLPALEDLGLGGWEPDGPGWRNGWVEPRVNRGQVMESWRMGFQKRKVANEGRKAITRGGWAPEGSFEFEMSNKASTAARERTRDRNALHKLAMDLRGLVISSMKVPVVIPAPPLGPPEEKPPSKTKRRIDKKDENTARVDTPTIPKLESTASTAMSKTSSKDGSETATGKKKPKKKKRSVLANQSNPHHVDNYRVSRTVSPQGDPSEPYPHHASLLFPPPMRLLSARPQRKIAPLSGSTIQNQPIRAQEDDFICCFCEIQLFYGSEESRRQAIRKLKAEQRRKEQIKTKAKNVAEGKGSLKDGGDYDDDEEEEWCGEGDAHGRCTCGRSLNAPHRTGKTRLKPPESDPPRAKITEIQDD